MIGQQIKAIIYSIKNLEDDILYIGESRRIDNNLKNVELRFSEHKREIIKNKHPYVSKNQYDKGIRFDILCLVYDDSFMVEMIENSYISLYKPHNGCVLGRNSVKSCSCIKAQNLLDSLEEQDIICRLDTKDKYEQADILSSI